jgi:hypothetical protein
VSAFAAFHAEDAPKHGFPLWQSRGKEADRIIREQGVRGDEIEKLPGRELGRQELRRRFRKRHTLGDIDGQSRRLGNGRR